MEDIFLKYFSDLSHELIVFIVSMLPLAELRLAIPLGVSFGFTPMYSALIAIVGSMIPVPFILLLIRPAMRIFNRTKIGSKFSNWLTEKALRGRKKVLRYKRLGLFIFVAIPLPTTGVWTGSLVASFLDIRIKDAVILIFLGNCVAATIMMALSHTAFAILSY